MNLLTNLYNPISSLYTYILDKYTNKNVKLYIIKWSPHIHEHIIMFEIDSFNNHDKIKNLNLVCFLYKQT